MSRCSAGRRVRGGAVPARAGRRDRARSHHRDRQHRRRHRAARPVDLARPRHGRLHAGRRRSTRTAAGASSASRGRRWTALTRYRGVTPDGSRAGTTWFGLGDRDLATHLYRTARLAEGATLTTVTAEIARAWGVGDHAAADDRRSRRQDRDRLAGAARSRSRTTSSGCSTASPSRAVRFDGTRCELSPAARRAIERRRTWS